MKKTDLEKSSAVNLERTVSEEIPLVHLVRKKGVEHTFLIIERLVEQDLELIRVDLFVSGDKPAFTIGGLYLKGESQIKYKVVTEEELSEYNQTGLCYQSFEATKEECSNLLKQVGKDSERSDIHYSSMGNNQMYKFSSSVNELHNCASYCINLLEKCLNGVKVSDNSWSSFAITRPSNVVPDSTPNENDTSYCRLM